MPTVTLNRNVFETLVGKKLPTEKLKERISMIGTDLESVTDTEIHVEVFPNRPDWLSEQGFARSFAAFIGKKTGLKAYPVKKSGLKVIVDKSVSMRPYTACAIVKKISFNGERIRELMQVQEKLATTHGRNRKKSAYGIYPLRAINFPIRYVAKNPKEVMFRPLGFPHPIPASDVEELHPKGKEYKHVAQGWKKYPFFIDAKNSVLCMLPYTNSDDTGKVDETTTEVFIECTGTERDNVQVALNILTTTLADMGGEIYSLDIAYPDMTITTPNMAPARMKLDIGYVNRRLGLALTENDTTQLLGKMGYGCEKDEKKERQAEKETEKGKGKKGKEEKIIVLIPAYRADILHPADVVEDIAIAYGYENFEEQIPAVATIAEEEPFEIFKSRIRELLIGLGMMETCSYSLIDERLQAAGSRLAAEEDGETASAVSKRIVRIIDPVSSEYNSLRFWLIPSVLSVLQKNSMAEYPQRIFEIGRVFAHWKHPADEKNAENRDTAETVVSEAERVCLAITHSTSGFTEAKQAVEYLLSQLGIAGVTQETEHTAFIPGRVGRVSVKEGTGKNEDIAYVGEIHPQVLNNFRLENPVAVAELNLTELWRVMKKDNK